MPLLPHKRELRQTNAREDQRDPRPLEPADLLLQHGDGHDDGGGQLGRAQNRTEARANLWHTQAEEDAGNEHPQQPHDEAVFPQAGRKRAVGEEGRREHEEQAGRRSGGQRQALVQDRHIGRDTPVHHNIEGERYGGDKAEDRALRR